MRSDSGIDRKLSEYSHELRMHPHVVDSQVSLSQPGDLVSVTVVVPKDCAPVIEGNRRVRISNGMYIVHQRDYETDYLYEEIFEDHCYLEHGLSLSSNGVVLDVGANIGMFSLYVAASYPGARVFAFEPAPPLYNLLVINLSLYAPTAQALQCGVAAKDSQEDFTFYPNSSVFSRFAADRKLDYEVLRTIVGNSIGAGEAGTPAHLIDQLLDGRLDAITFPVRTRSLASLIAEFDIEEIDLLKIDAEWSELDILNGLDDNDWPRVRQVVLESHGGDSNHQAIVAVLRDRGFDTAVDCRSEFRGTGFANVYAWRAENAIQRADRAPIPCVVEDQIVSEDDLITLARCCGLPESVEVNVRIMSRRE